MVGRLARSGTTGRVVAGAAGLGLPLAFAPFGYYVVALMAAVLAVLVLRVLTRIEKEWIRDADDGARRDAEAE